MSRSELYRFGEFTLDTRERVLVRGRQRLRLTPKAQDLLTTLVVRAGHLVRKRELLDLVWPDAFVEEGILTVHMTAVRRMLGDDPRRPRFIETVPGAGYRFIAAVHAVAPTSERRQDGDRVEATRERARLLEMLGQGRRRLLSASMRELRDVVPLFEDAIARDPAHAGAHAGLALAWCAQAELRMAPAAPAYAHARTSALRALAIDSLCADAQVALATVLFLGEWEWDAAERCLTRALSINPDYTEAYLLSGRLLEAVGRLQEGLEAKLHALEREPDSPAVHQQIALSYWNQRRYDDCIDWANRTLALDPSHLVAREHLAGAYLMKGDAERYLAESIAHATAYGMSREALAPLEAAFKAGGRPGVVRYALDQARAQARAPDVQLAQLLAESGDLDGAFDHLDRALDARDPCLVHLAVAPQWDRLRADPRFRGCLARMNLPETAGRVGVSRATG